MKKDVKCKSERTHPDPVLRSRCAGGLNIPSREGTLETVCRSEVPLLERIFCPADEVGIEG